MVPKRPALRELCYEAFAVLHSGETKTPVYVAQRLNRKSIEDADEAEGELAALLVKKNSPQFADCGEFFSSAQTWSAAGSYSFFSERVSSSSSSLTTALTPAAATSTVVPTTVAPTLTVVATTLTAASATVTTAQALSIAVAATSSKFLAGWCMVLECNNPRSDKTGNGGYGIRCCAAGKACSGGCGYSNSMMT